MINLDDPVGTATRSTLLLKAVQDCFIGRHFIFGIKVLWIVNYLKLSSYLKRPWYQLNVNIFLLLCILFVYYLETH